MTKYTLLSKLKILSKAIFGAFLELLPRKLFDFSKSLKEDRRLDFSLDVPRISAKKMYQKQKLIVLDSFAIPHWAVINAVAASKIAIETDSKVATFNFTGRNFSEKSLYDSLGIYKHLRISITPITFFKTVMIFVQKILELLSGRKIIDLHFGPINVGLDIYESFLRRGNPTVNLYSKDLYRELWRAIKEFVYFEPLFSENRVSAILVSHDSYVGPGLLTRIAFNYEVPAFLVNPFEINIVSRDFQLYERFLRYREYFASQPLGWKEEKLGVAKIELYRRITGEIGVGTMRYQTRSAFSNNQLVPQVNLSDNKKLLVLCHDFFDNPHAYSRMLFDDFLDWLSFVVQTCNSEQIDCYLKLHRDFSEIELNVVKDFQAKNPFVTLLDSDVSYHQLFNEGIRFATTCYGSAGHELPLLGFTVINASYNPHIAYDFNYHASSITEYRQMLVDQIPIVLDDLLESQIYEFYAVHTFLMWPDSFNLRSFLEFDNYCQGDFKGVRALEFLEKDFQDISNRVIQNLTEAIQNMRSFSVERSLPKGKQSIEKWTPSRLN